MATATLPVAYGDFTDAGIGSGVLVRPEVLSEPQQEGAQPRSFPVVTVDFGSAPSARPQQSVLFGALLDPKLRLLKAIPLELSIEGSDVILTWQEIDEFGCGDSTTAALEDFGQSVRELYHHLHGRDIKLGDDLERVKHVLDQYIEPRK